MDDQERTIAYEPQDYEESALPEEEDASYDPGETDPEDLSDAEYAEIIGEESLEPETEQEDIPAPDDVHIQEEPAPRKEKKRRKSRATREEVSTAIHDSLQPVKNTGSVQPRQVHRADDPHSDKITQSDQHVQITQPARAAHRTAADTTEEEKRTLHNIGGVDTLRTTGGKTEEKEIVRAASSKPVTQKQSEPNLSGKPVRANAGNEDVRSKEHTPKERPVVSKDQETPGQHQSDSHRNQRNASAAEPSVQARHIRTVRLSHITRDMEHGGSASLRATRSYLSGRETAEQTGERNIRRYGAVVSDAAGILSAAGGKAVARQQQLASRQFAEGAVHAEQAIASGVIHTSDLLLSKKALREKMKGSSLSKSEQWSVVKNRKAIHDALVVKTELIRMKDTAPNQKTVFSRDSMMKKRIVFLSEHETRKHIKILTSDRGKFFNDFKYGTWTQNMISVYFSRHMDPMLRKVNPARMRVSELKRLLSHADRYRLKPVDIAMIRTLIRGKTAMKNRAADRFSGLAGGFRTVHAISRRGVRALEQADDAAAEGVRRVTTVYHGIRTVKPVVHLAGTATVKTAGAVWRLPPVAHARRLVMKPVRKGTEAAASAVKTAGRSVTDTVKTIASNRILRTRTASGLASATAKELVHTTGIASAGVKTVGTTESLRTAAGTAKAAGKTAKRAASRKTGGVLARRLKKIRESRILSATSRIGRGIGSVVHITTTPIRWTAIGFHKLHHGIRKIITAVLVVIFAVILVFLLLLMFSAFVTSMGNSTGEIIEKVVTDDDLAAHIRHLNDRNLAKFQEAVDIVKAGPQHDADHIDSTGRYPDEAFGGEKLYHYGSPNDKHAPEADLYHNDLPGEVPGGFHYIYLDANGHMIGNNTNNTKDIICLTSVMVGNDYDEEVLTLAPELMDVWFDYLNPAPTYTVSELYHREGSDVFPHETYTFIGSTYYCNDSVFYDKYNAAVADGVHFYESPQAQTVDGCKTDWDTFWNDYNDWWESRPEYPEYPDPDDYEDDDEWEEARDAYYEALEEYWEERDLWYDSQPDSDDYHYCPGHDALSCSYGYRDVNVYVTILTKDDVFAAANNGNILTYRVPTDYACTTWETRSVSLDIPAAYTEVTKSFVRDQGWKNPKHQQWCNNLYAGDWFSLYGVDTYEDSVSLPTGEGRLSQEQIDEMIARIGDVSAARQAIVNFALDYVGRIPYYWGGKPSVPGYDGNNFNSIVDPDYKGRNRKGLDCSGFVGWVYWSVTGIKPCPVLSTANIVPALGLCQIGFDELMPGDIGMEAPPGAGSNHIGYFVGYNEDGRARWVHSSGGTGGVGVNTANCFRYYYRLFED